MRGDFLPPQIIYSGKTPRCLPSVKFADNWHITYTANHWANEETSLAYIEKILTPYVNQKRRELSLDIQHPALVIFDRFKGQCTCNVFLALSLLYQQIALIVYSLLTSAWTNQRKNSLENFMNGMLIKFAYSYELWRRIFTCGLEAVSDQACHLVKGIVWLFQEWILIS